MPLNLVFPGRLVRDLRGMVTVTCGENPLYLLQSITLL